MLLNFYDIINQKLFLSVFLLCMVHPKKIFTSVGLAQAYPNYYIATG